MLTAGMLQVNMIKIGEECNAKIFSMTRVLNNRIDAHTWRKLYPTMHLVKMAYAAKMKQLWLEFAADDNFKFCRFFKNNQ